MHTNEENKLSEGNKLDEGDCLTLYATDKLLDCLQEAHFSGADTVRQRVLVLTALPGGTEYLADVFAVLTDAIRTKERTCTEQHLATLIETLDESIADAQNPEVTLPPNEGFTEEDSQTLQRIGLCLDALQQKGFADSKLVGEQVCVLAPLTEGAGWLEVFATRLSEISAEATPGCEETGRRISDMVKGLSEEIAEAQKGQKAPAESLKIEPGPPPPWPRRFKDTVSYGQPPPLEAPAPPECEAPRGNHGR